MKRVMKDKFVMTITIGPKSQIVIPKMARDMFNWKPGDTVVLLGDKQKGLAIVDQKQFFNKKGI